MVADLSASTYLVDGVDLQTATVELTHDGAGLWSGLAEVLTVTTYPGVDKGDLDGGVFRPYTHTTMFTVHGDDYDDVWAQIRALRRRCKPGRTVTLTRQMPDPDGTAANTNHTTVARRQTDRVEWDGPKDAVVDVDWMIVDPPWHGPSTTISSGAGTQAILGDTRTRRITLTLSAGAARTVANQTNGYQFVFLGTVPTGGAVVDVEARTATAVTGGADLSSALVWSKTDLFQLEAGSNVLATDVGSFSVSYQPAYL